MNIRNLLFTTMILCAASSFATATADRPKINLIKKEQRALKNWIKTVRKQTPENRQIIKVEIAALRNLGLFVLSKIRAGKINPKHMEDIAQRLFASKVDDKIKQIVKKFHPHMKSDEFDRHFEKVMKQVDEVMSSFPLDRFLNPKEVLNGEGITKKDIVMLKKLVVIGTFILKHL